MVEEIAFIQIQPGKEAAFEEAVAKAKKEIFGAAPGLISVSLGKGEERPDVYALRLTWENIEDHTVTFVNSDGFEQWRNLVGSMFASAPTLEHWHPVDLGA
jgi:heme-degrading monooxygenase HmoA